MKKYYVYKPKNNTISNNFVNLLFLQGNASNRYYDIDKYYGNYNDYFETAKTECLKFVEGHIYVYENGYIVSEFLYPTRFIGQMCDDFEEIKISEKILREIKALKSSKEKHDLIIDIVPKCIDNNGEIIYRCTPITFSGLYKKINFYKLMSVSYGEGKTPTDALISFNNKLRKILLFDFLTNKC